jgi:L-methionine (R)-S-oxide reductase
MPLASLRRTSRRGHRYNLRPILPFYPSLAIMFTAATASIKPDYALLARQAASILEDERDLTANAAQFSAFIYDTIADLNWAGFYLVKPAKKAVASGPSQELLVGPFQGKVACARIAFGRGVCGTSAAERRTIVVADVHAFPGHIACDSASNAEIVIPVIKNGELFGVFDIDSPSLNRFSEEDRQGLEALVAIFVAATDFKLTS